MSDLFEQSLTVGAATSRWPGLIPFFEQHKIDYCCKGSTPLRIACEEAGVSLVELETAAGIAKTRESGQCDWTTSSMSDLCDHIVTEFHIPTRKRFDVLQTLVPKVVAVHLSHAPWLGQVAEIERELRAEMLDHMVREERVLFPWIKRLEQRNAVTIGPPWSVKRPIDCMMHDHDSVGSALRRIHALTSEYVVPNWACASMRRMLEQLQVLETDTHVHIHLENNILFPAAVRAESHEPRSSAMVQ